jgi:predicted transcriptional regulator
MTKKAFSRIAITLPARDLAAADRLARKQDRSRSWVVAEAVRRYVALHIEESDEAGAPSAATAAIADELRAGGARRPGLGDSRLDQLRRDMALTPEERVRAAEETALLSELRVRPRPRQLLQFDRFEAYLEWKRREFV